MLWHEQSWPELAACDRQMPVIVPLGSCEQHGHHLPVWVDTFQVDAIARRVEEQMRDRVLLTPTLWLGSSHHHLDFAGTISLRPALYSQVIQDVALSILKAGFERIFFLNGHGGNEVPVAQAMTDLIATNDQADNAYLSMASWWKVARQGIEATRDQLKFATRYLSHACEYETSVMLALRPDLVHPDRISQAGATIDSRFFHSELGGGVQVYRRFRRWTASGSMGTPSAATPAKGDAILDAVVADVVAYVDELRSWPPLPAKGPMKPQAHS